jgi:RNA polymerase sigma factor (sigma-70 family)
VTKEKLQQYKHIKWERDQIRQKLAELEAGLGSAGGSNLDGMPRSSGPGDPTGRAALQLLALREHYDNKLAELAELQLAIEKAIDSLEPTERKLLRHRYIDGLRWEDICVAMSYSWRQIHRLHSAALQKLREMEE